MVGRSKIVVRPLQAFGGTNQFNDQNGGGVRVLVGLLFWARGCLNWTAVSCYFWQNLVCLDQTAKCCQACVILERIDRCKY